jgi:hypothetical protein
MILKNIEIIAQQILSTQGLGKKFKEAIEEYSGKKVKKIEFIEDPQVEGTYAIRSDKQDEWLVVHYNPSWSTKELADSLEEAEFTKWPPVSGELRFF